MGRKERKEDGRDEMRGKRKKTEKEERGRGRERKKIGVKSERCTGIRQRRRGSRRRSRRQ